MSQLEEQIKQLQKPDADEIEITTIGVGGFEGESIVIHFGNGRWGVVDSCKSQGGENLPLFYLKTLGVPLSDVDIVVCTHWHSDHINGLSEILSECLNARFEYPIVGQKNNLLKYLIEGEKAQGKSSVWHEFIRCVKAVPKSRIHYGISDRIVYDKGDGTMLVALSPAEKMLDVMHEALVKFDAKDSDLSKINETVITPNMCSTALLLITPYTSVLLGADLEANRNKRNDILSCIGSCNARWEKGWCNVIVTSNSFRTRKASYFKLPHHSSETGYCQEVWKNHVVEPVSVSTVFVNNKGVKLPKKDMLVRYKNLSTELYMTSSGPKKREKKTGRSELDKNKSNNLLSLAVMNEEKGIICSRKKSNNPWQTHLLGTAIAIDDTFVKQYN